MCVCLECGDTRAHTDTIDLCLIAGGGGVVVRVGVAGAAGSAAVAASATFAAAVAAADGSRPA